jgi:hypothetical protein
MWRNEENIEKYLVIGMCLVIIQTQYEIKDKALFLTSLIQQKNICKNFFHGDFVKFIVVPPCLNVVCKINGVELSSYNSLCCWKLQLLSFDWFIFVLVEDLGF